MGPNAVFAIYIFIHHTNAWSLVSDKMPAELSKGNITPQMYGLIYEASNGKRGYENEVNYFASGPCWRKECKSLIKHHLREINEARWSIGLGKYEVMEKKDESSMLYRKWCSKEKRAKEPYFDFQFNLNFQGIRS